MIQSKGDLRKYLEADRIALGQSNKKPRILGDEIWKYQILLRKCEYYNNCKKGFIYKVLFIYNKYRFRKLGIKLGFTIPINVFSEGLSIAHYGTIVVNETARIGKNCRIHEGVTIGATNGNPKAAQIGDNVFIGSGAKIIGDITLGDRIAIGANSVVVKSCNENNVTLAGSPARIVSKNGSRDFLIRNE